jgi:hypothetical protein
MYNIMAKTMRRKNYQKGCGKCKKVGGKKCTHRVQSGGCTSCIGGGKKRKGSKKQVGGTGFVDNISNITTGVTGMVWNVFRGFQGVPPVPMASF